MPKTQRESMGQERTWRLERGARVLGTAEGGGVHFSVWAPRAEHLGVRLVGAAGRMLPMDRSPEGVFSVTVADAAAGSDYLYVLPAGHERPDPVSRHQPQGVHGPSRVVDPAAFSWTDSGWTGLPLEQYVVYELHVGTFSPQGTFAGVERRLPYLKDLGVTAVELMPVVTFPGARNWGYDGVDLYAPHPAYGGPEGLKALVDACHRAGLAVVLDVVYNHLGPEGNYLGEFGPYFTGRYRTPWGEALNFDGPDSDEVRRFFIDNACYWLTEYHVDALRLDAIHGIFDFSALHLLEEMKLAFAAQAERLGRRAFLIAESDLNDVRVIRPRARGGFDLDSQWSDDFHHALFTVLTGARHGYFQDFGRLDDLRKAIAEGFVYDGRYSPYRRRRHGNSPAEEPGHKLVVCLQNHDQIANASQGRRLSHVASLEQQKTAAALLACTPNLPMLFMGQEWASTSPFHYFTSHGDPDLAEAVRRGRRQEFIHFAQGGEYADPQAAETFTACKLDWEALARPPHRWLWQLYRELLRLRRSRPALAHARRDLTSVAASEEKRYLTVVRRDPDADGACLLCNFGPTMRAIPVPIPALGWELALWTEDPAYGGTPETKAPPLRLAPEPLCLPGWSAALYLAPNAAAG
jgi:maltooligosyltrehalose trehalohydrolase